jgi:hypothetical protein
MHATRDDLPILFGTEHGGIRGVDWGNLRAAIVIISAGTDLTPLFKGLPDDRCPCPHWGYVLTGAMKVTYANGEEMIQTGEVFYLPPGHVVTVVQDLQYVEFSPIVQHNEFLTAARNNASKANAS